MISTPSRGSASPTCACPWAPAGGCAFSRIAHNAGLSVSELKPEIATENAIVSANCL